MSPQPDPLDADTAFGLLSNGRRRRLLRELHRAGTVPLRETARRIAAAEAEAPAAAVDASTHKSVYVSLYQTHVPRLAERGVVRYDPEAKAVSLVPSPATRRLLRLLEDDDRPTGRYYAAAALVGAGLVAVTLFADGGETAWRAVAGAVGAATAGLAAAEGRDRSEPPRPTDGGVAAGDRVTEPSGEEVGADPSASGGGSA